MLGGIAFPHRTTKITYDSNADNDFEVFSHLQFIALTISLKILPSK